MCPGVRKLMDFVFKTDIGRPVTLVVHANWTHDSPQTRRLLPPIKQFENSMQSQSNLQSQDG